MSFDLFFFWRYLLTVAVAIYCVVTAIDRVLGFWRLMHGEERHWDYVRKYVAVQLLRVSWRDAGPELTQIVLWLVVLFAIVGGHVWSPAV